MPRPTSLERKFATFLKALAAAAASPVRPGSQNAHERRHSASAFGAAESDRYRRAAGSVAASGFSSSRMTARNETVSVAAIAKNTIWKVATEALPKKA